MDSAALLAHIVSQTRQNIDFLVAQKQLSEHDGRDILLRLPNSPGSDSPTSRLIQQTQNLDIRSNSPATPSRNSYAPSYLPPSGPPVPQRPPLFQGKATWGYNESGQNPGDLSFRAGETIDIIAETNADWWTGRHNGKEGLFPSNYVQRLPPSGAPPAPIPYQEKAHNHGPPPGYPIGPGPGPGPIYPSYQSPPPPQGYQGGPPPHPYASYGPPPVQVVQAAPPPAPAPAPEPEKKSGLGSSLANTLAHSAVGGVGVGAGSAIGSGIIHSLF